MSEKPLKLVLKVGSDTPGTSPNAYASSPMEDDASELDGDTPHSKRHKKKKKKKNKEKHRHHHHHDIAESEKKEALPFKSETREEAIETVCEEVLPVAETPETVEVTASSEEVVRTSETPNDATALVESDATEPPAKKQAVCSGPEAVIKLTDISKRTCTLHRPGDMAPGVLHKLLGTVLKALERKDVNQFFAWPVTDTIAPGYSSIIKQPMDFSTMRRKVEDHDYFSVADFKADFRLMCDNAMTYNNSETIYYKAAKTLLHVGVKLLSKERVSRLCSTLGITNELGTKELGLDNANAAPITDVEGTVIEERPKRKSRRRAQQSLKPEEQSEDEITADEILAQAQAAAKGARERLMFLNPNSKMGFLRRDKHGATTLAILNPDNIGVEPGSESRPVNLGMLTGKLASGTGQIHVFKEDKRNKATPVSYLHYGAYGSHGPTYDSTFANVTKEESDLLYSTYGDDAAVQYAESLLNFVKGSADFPVKLVTGLLDSLTNGEHSKSMKILEEKNKAGKDGCTNISQEDADKPLDGQAKKDVQIADIEALKSLQELGIDTSFLNGLEKELNVSQQRDMLQSKLNETSSLLVDLKNAQVERLSTKPPPHLAYVAGPTPSEEKIAAKVLTNLKAMTAVVAPGSVIGSSTVRKAIGVTLDQARVDAPSDMPPEESNVVKQESQEMANQPQSNTGTEVAEPMHVEAQNISENTAANTIQSEHIASDAGNIDAPVPELAVSEEVQSHEQEPSSIIASLLENPFPATSPAASQ